MAKHSIIWANPTENFESREHVLEAASDAQARIRFMNLSWVAFTAIYILSVAVKGDQPEEAKEAAKADPLAGVQPHAYQQRLGGSACTVCREGAGHRIHAGFDPIVDREPDRFNRDDKRGAAAVKAAAAGLVADDVETADIVANLTRKHATERVSASENARRNGLTATSWHAEVDRLSIQIGNLADEAQELTRKGEHDEADKLRARAKTLAEKRAEITKRNRKK